MKRVASSLRASGAPRAHAAPFISIAAAAAATLAFAAPALAKPIALIAGPVAALPHGYSMLLIAGQGAAIAPQSGVLGGCGPHHSQHCLPGGSKDSLSILFSRKLRASSGTEVLLQEYTFPIRSSVLTVLADTKRFIVNLSGSGRSYGTISMSLAHGKLSGLDGFVDLPFRGPSSLPAQLVSGTADQVYLRHTHLPKPAGTPSCPPPGFAGLFGFTEDPEKNFYFASAVRQGLMQKLTILASELPNPSTTAPATEFREVALTGAPNADLTVQPPSQNGNATNSGGALVVTTGGSPRLQGSLSFDNEFALPVHGCGGVTVAGGTILAGSGSPNHVTGNFQAIFDGPARLGSDTVTFWGIMRGELIYH